MVKPAQLVPICMRLVVISIISSLLYNFVGRMKDGTYTNESALPLYLLCFATCCFRIFCNHAGGHRYFAHKSFKCAPWLVQVMAFTIAETELGLFFMWAFQHNEHHAKCDVGGDDHSPHKDGFWAVQFGYTEGMADLVPRMLKLVGPGAPRNEQLRTKYESDISWLDIPANLLIFFGSIAMWGVVGKYLGYPPADFILWGSSLPRFLSCQAMALTNSAAHMFGDRPYTGNNHAPFPKCMATNCWWVSLLNGGEGWHNNHHAFCLSARHGLLWHEIDAVWMTLRVLAHCGVVWDMIEVTDEVRTSPRTPSKVMNFERKYQVLYTTDLLQKVVE